MRMVLITMLALVMTGCGEHLKRTVYETLRESGRQKCLQQGTTQCSSGEGYDDYQLRRKELEEDR